MLGYWALRFLSFLLCHTPGFICRRLAKFFGWLSWQITPAWRKRMAIGNIKECLGVDEVRAGEIAKASVTRFGRMLVEVLRFPVLRKEELHSKITVEGMEYLDAAYKLNRGVIIATAHFGNWEMLGAALALYGYPILSVVRKQNNSAMDEFINEYREISGQKIVYNHGGSNMMAINRILKEHKLLGLLYDQDTAADCIAVPFLGKMSSAPLGPAVFSRLHRAPALPVFLHNDGADRFVMRVHPPVFTAKSEDRERDLRVATEELLLIAEQEITSDPAMWFWVHDRWKDGRKRYKETQA